MAKIFFEIDGKLTPIDDCSWLMYAPCGCMCGVSTVRDNAMTEAAAWESLASNAEQRRRDHAAGFRIVLGRRSQVRDLNAECPHTPMWGVEKTPVPGGHQWARTVHPPIGRRKHLVPDIAVENYVERRYGAGKTAALCGSEAWAWSTKWHDIDVPECRACAKKASA